MRKTNMLKSVVCGLMIMLITGTTVFAGTVTRDRKVRNVTTYTDEYSGAVGNYCAAGDSTIARTSIQNTSQSSKWYACYVYRYNYNSCSYDKQAISSKSLANGATMCVSIARNKNSSVYDYYHVANGYASNTASTATLVDVYTFTAMQYYR